MAVIDYTNVPRKSGARVNTSLVDPALVAAGAGLAITPAPGQGRRWVVTRVYIFNQGAIDSLLIYDGAVAGGLVIWSREMLVAGGEFEDENPAEFGGLAMGSVGNQLFGDLGTGGGAIVGPISITCEEVLG